MAIYAKLPNVKGGVTMAGYVGWVELNSLQFGAGNAAPPAGSGGGAGKPAVSEITVTKQLDTATVPVFRDLLLGTTLTPVVLAFTSAAPGVTTEFLRYILSGVLVTQYSLSSGGDRPAESLSFAFTEIDTTVTTTAPSGATTKQTVTYTVATNQVG